MVLFSERDKRRERSSYVPPQLVPQIEYEPEVQKEQFKAAQMKQDEKEFFARLVQNTKDIAPRISKVVSSPKGIVGGALDEFVPEGVSSKPLKIMNDFFVRPATRASFTAMGTAWQYATDEGKQKTFDPGGELKHPELKFQHDMVKAILGDEPITTLTKDSTINSPESRALMKESLDAAINYATFGQSALLKGMSTKVVAPTIMKSLVLVNRLPKIEFTARSIVPITKALDRAAIGSSLAASFMIGNEEKSWEDIGKTSFVVGALSAGVPPITGMMMRYGGKKITQMKKFMDPKYDKFLDDLEKQVFEQRDTVFTGPAADYERSFNRSKAFKRYMADKTLKIIRGVETLPDKFLSRISFVDSMRSQIKIKGGSLDDADKLERTMTLALPSAAERARLAQEGVDKIADAASMRGLDDQLMVYIKALDDLDTVRAGKKISTINKATGKMKTEAEILGDLDVFAKDWGEEIMGELETFSGSLQLINRGALTELYLKGVITLDSFENILKAHPNYIPHSVVVNTIEEGAKKMGVLDSLNLSKSPLFKRAGSERMIENPLVAMKSKFPLLYAATERSRAMLTISDIALRNKHLRTFKGVEIYQSATKTIKRKKILKELGGLKEELARIKKGYKITNAQDRKLVTKINKLYKELDDTGTKAIKNFVAETGDEVTEDLARMLNKGVNKKLTATEIKKAEVETVLNKTIKSLKEKKAQIADVVEDLKLTKQNKLTDNEIAERGLAKVEYFVSGEKEVLLLPKRIVDAVKNLEYEQIGKLMNAMVTFSGARLLRKNATQRSIGFIFSNPSRDVQSAYINSPHGLAASGFLDVLFQSNPELLQKTASYGTFMGAGITQVDDYSKLIADGTRGTLWHKIKNKNPLKQLDEISSRLENATRNAVFVKAISKGATEQEAAFLARNASVDFARVGSMMAGINKFVPFLNARIQGTVQLTRAFKKNPELVMEKLFWSAAVPEAMLYNYNRKFETYKTIPQYMLDRYWVIMVGEIEAIDDSGNPVKTPQYVVFPKGEPQKIVSNLLNHVLKKADGIDKRGTGEALLDLVGSFSPIPFDAFKSDDMVRGLAASIGPLPRIGMGLATNVDPFTGYNIIPDDGSETSLIYASPDKQYRKRTTETAKALSKPLGVSAAFMEFVADSYGGLPKQMLQLSDTFQGKGKPSISGTPFGSLANTPGSGTFFRETLPRETVEAAKMKRIFEDVRTKIADDKAVANIQYNKVLEQIIGTPKEDRGKLILELANQGVLDEKMAKKITERLTKAVSFTDNKFRSLGIESGGLATALNDYFGVLTPEKKASEMERLLKNGIITETVAKQLTILLLRDKQIVPE